MSTVQYAEGDWPFVARDEELDLLTGVLAAGATTSRSTADVAPTAATAGAVVVAGAGVGKTRLLREALAWGRRHDMPTTLAIGTESAAATPYAALAHLAPEVVAEQHSDPTSLHLAIAAALRGSDAARHILAVDDAHLLDPGSAALVLHLALTGTATVIVSVRSGAPVPDPITALWKDGLALRVDLQQFSLEETERLICRVLDDRVALRTARLLAEASRGNALYTRELVLGAIDSGSLRLLDGLWGWDGQVVLAPRLVDAVGARLEGLSDAQSRALALVALAEPLPVTTAERLVDGDALAALETRGLLRLDGDDFRLGHPLYGEVRLSQLGRLQRRQLLRALIAELDAQVDEARYALRTTDWLLEIGAQPAASRLLRAARLANSSFGFDQGHRLAAAAVRSGGGAEASVVLAQAEIGRRRFAEAEQALAAAEQAVLAGTAAVRTEYLEARYRALYLGLGRAEAMAAALERFTASSSDARDQQLVAGYRAGLLLDAGQLDEAVASTAPVLDDPDAAGWHVLLAAEIGAEALAYTGRTQSARTLHERMRMLGDTGRPELVRGRAHAQLQEMLCQFLEGRVREAMPVTEEFYRQVATGPDPMTRGLAALALGALQLARGTPVTARRTLAEATLALGASGQGGAVPWVLAIQAQAEALCGDLTAAQASVQRSRQLQPRRGTPRSESDFLLADALIEMAAGQPAAGSRVLLEGADRLSPEDMRRVTLWHWAARLGAEPEPLIGPMTALARVAEHEQPRLLAGHVRAIAEQDAAALEESADRFDELGQWLCAAEAAAAGSLAAHRQGRTATGHRLAARSRLLAARCESARTPALSVAEPAADLSRRELEVAELAAVGLSNAEIADRLTVSVRTVESHLYRAFGKLGVERREQLATVLSASS